MRIQPHSRVRQLALFLLLCGACGDDKDVVEISLRFDGAAVSSPVSEGTWYRPAAATSCHRYEECSQLRPFTAADKPVWNAEYSTKDDRAAAVELATMVCPGAVSANIRSLIIRCVFCDLLPRVSSRSYCLPGGSPRCEKTF